MHTDVNILVVDDDPQLLSLLLETLRTLGYNASGAPDGCQALQMLEERPYRLVATDINMPGMSGIDLSQLIKDKYPALPVIFISGVFAHEDVAPWANGEFLAKPFRIGQLEELIEKVLAKAEVKTPIPEPKNVLVVDDDQAFQIMLMEVLKLGGYTPKGASNGKEALNVLASENIRAVVTDMKMPVMDGLTLARQIRQFYPNLPVIVVTAYPPDSLELAGTEERLTLLTKPFRVEEILEILDDLTGAPARSGA